MRTPEDVVQRLTVAWRRNWTDWLGGGGTWPLVVSLDPPTEASASSRWAEFVRWLERWQAYAGPGQVRLGTKAWTRKGTQTLPTHVEFANPSAVSQALGGEAAATFSRADARFAERIAAWPECDAALRTHADWVQALPSGDYERAVRVIDWLSANPDTGLYPRQLPIEGVDTKWLEANAGPIAALLAERLSMPKAPLATLVGLRVDMPKRRLRLLDPVLRARFGGLGDLTVPIDELAAIDPGASVVLVVENQQTLLACEALPGAIAIAGGGFAAAELAQLPWLHACPVIYWGDVDVAGFQILSSLRARLPHAESCLMDEDTLLRHRALWSVDPIASRVREIGHLTPAEATVAQGLVDGRWGLGVRLEQERIPWPHAWARVIEAAIACQAGCVPEQAS